MSLPDIFKGGAIAKNNPLYEKLNAEFNDKFGSGGGGSFPPRISIKGARFRKFENGEQTHVSKDNEMNIVIVDAAAIGRTFYEGEYDEKAEAKAPMCWSVNREVPADDVPEANRQSKTCMTCPQNVKTDTKGRACRFHQRLAIIIEGDWETIHQLQVPATSIFGDNGPDLGLQSYGRLLQKHGVPACAVITTMYFDEDSPTPKLFFRPVRELTPEELDKVVALREHEHTKIAIANNPAKVDGVPDTKAKPEPKRAAEQPKPKRQKKATVVEVEPEEIPEPVKVETKKPAPTAAVESDSPDALAQLMADWDDEDDEDDD